MIKSSNISIKFTNSGKLTDLARFRAEYASLCLKIIDLMWDMDKIPALPPKAITDLVKEGTWLSARAVQACAKQAAGIVNGTRKKTRQRQFVADKLEREGKHKQSRKILAVIKKNPMSKPKPEKINPQLDGRFVKIIMEGNHFDGWLVLSSLGNGKTLKIPIQKTKHVNKLLDGGFNLNGSHATLCSDHMTFVFEKDDVIKRSSGSIVGLDVGIKSVVTLSDGQSGVKDSHGWDLDEVLKRLARRKKGSKNQKKTQAHRKNLINYNLNKIDLSGIKTIRLEKIKNMRRGKRTSAFLSRWTYTDIFGKLEDMCLLAGVQTQYINPTYTSQRCSNCGWTRKKNRKGVSFKCDKCGFATNADLNASLNISLDLLPIGKKERLERNNIKGFYWSVLGKEPIVPSVLKPCME